MCLLSNAWYRVRHRVVQDEKTALPVLQFQHPVAPGNDEGGWMKPPKVEESASKPNEKLKTFSLEEISKHSSKVYTALCHSSPFCAMQEADPPCRTTRGSSWITKSTT